MASSSPVDVAVKGVGRVGVGAKISKTFLILSLGNCLAALHYLYFFWPSLAKQVCLPRQAVDCSANTAFIMLPRCSHPVACFANSWSQ